MTRAGEIPFNRVYAITPNPALDLSGEASRITENEKTYIFNERRYPGGNAINAARILTRLRYRVQAGGFIGGTIGSQLECLLYKEGVRTDFVAIHNETRVDLTISNRQTHKQTRLSFPGPRIDRAEKNKLLGKINEQKQGSLLLLGGSFPPHFGVIDAKAIVKTAHLRKVATIVDVPPRSLRSLLQSRPLMIKPNLLEFEELVGKKTRQIPEIISEARKLLKFCPLICISSVKGGALLVTPAGCYFAKGPRIRAKSSVGAGDSMVGGMAAGVLKSLLSYQAIFSDDRSSEKIEPGVWPEILKLGMGAALATISCSGTQLGSRSDILSYSKKIKVRRINETC